ncbi:LTA synthase family protein [Pseudomonas syringae]|uniref:Sulfatase n=1 Tax=Pseudomonas syringae TaxID=317 RepID=A0A085VQD8_PSESX|nr:LTA synthase family protein [Pseudomonas syringae]KFE57651.1 sulfatase [Pseudomonas syringae]
MSDLLFASATLGGLCLTVGIEAILKPRPRLLRPLSCWLLHSGVWCLLLTCVLALTGRVWFSVFSLLAGWLLIVLVSNAKFHTLREPFVFADFEYFSDAVRFPRLYLPFFGMAKTAAMAAGFCAYLVFGLYFERPATDAWLKSTLLLGAGAALVALGMRPLWKPSFAPELDLRNWGLVFCLWTYFLAGRSKVDITTLGSPFLSTATQPPDHRLPDMISIQSESFFDVRRLYSGVKPQVLQNFDLMRSESLAQGELQVAAWGANTVRSEFAYLTGLSSDSLGVHRFNPYRVLARQGLPSIATHLKQQGYRTICIHPFAGGFYGRDRVLPALGFDEFIDGRAFDTSQKAGPFIADSAVAEKILALLDAPGRTEPLFIHAITMENHGPLHLEQVDAAQLPDWFDGALSKHLSDLGPYVRHIANADHMLGMLRQNLKASLRPANLCFFGDHVPILPSVYRALGEPDGSTDYFIWSNRVRHHQQPKLLAVDHLAKTFIELTQP